MPISQLANSETEGDSSKTFIFEGENDTLGNALQTVISGNPDVYICAYSVTRSEVPVMDLRIQMKKGKAIDALKKGLEELATISDHILSTFEQERNNFELNLMTT